MKRLSTLAAGVALSVLIASPVFAAWTWYDFETPCDAIAGKNWQYYSGGTIYTTYDTDPNYAVIDKPDSYVFYAGWARVCDPTCTSYIGW